MARYKFTDDFEQLFIDTCNNLPSMSQAAQELKMNYKTLCSHAKRLGCFKPNQAGNGIAKTQKVGVVTLQDIFDGKYKTYQSHKLKLKLLRENVKLAQCENCELTEWFKQPIPLELHHIDGNRYNNAFNNLKLLCPNCHALTDNYRAKNIRNLSA